MKTISIVTPCYNEEENVRDCYAAIKAIFDEQLTGFVREHIFCDNASTDATPDILKALAAEDPNVRVIMNARNFGPARSTFNGVMAASGDAVLLFMPADMQDPPALIPQFVALWQAGNDIVYGIRANREEGALMRWTRNAYYQTISKLSSVKIPPNTGDFQLVDRSVVESMRRIDDSYPFMRIMTFECSSRVVGVEYRWLARKKGISKNRISSLLDQGLNGLTTFTSAPLRGCLYVGFLISVISILYSVVTLVAGLAGGHPATAGIMTLIVALFFFGGVQLFVLGMLGEYVLAIYAQVRHKPLVFERERLNFKPAQSE
jgi:glycosyltransferase involved in cell wall biosynthesis